jgi:hypothetical protein
MNTNEFIPYNESLELKNLGFNDECNAYYYPSQMSIGWDLVQSEIPERNSTLVIGITAPTYRGAFIWAEVNYNWGIHVFNLPNGGWDYYIYQQPDEQITDDGITYSTFEEAKLACVKKLIQMIKTI